MSDPNLSELSEAQLLQMFLKTNQELGMPKTFKSKILKALSTNNARSTVVSNVETNTATNNKAELDAVLPVETLNNNKLLELEERYLEQQVIIDQLINRQPTKFIDVVGQIRGGFSNNTNMDIEKWIAYVSMCAVCFFFFEFLEKFFRFNLKI